MIKITIVKKKIWDFVRFPVRNIFLRPENYDFTKLVYNSIVLPIELKIIKLKYIYDYA